MVGVRFRRSLFPGYSDTVEYSVDCGGTGSRPGSPGEAGKLRQFDVPRPVRAGKYTVTAILQYRKVDQFLANYMMGADSGVTAAVVEIDRATAVFEVPPATASARGTAAARIVATP
jgi:hypothetical protein